MSTSESSRSGDRTQASSAPADIRLFLGGDVMTGRGIDQILPEAGSPELHESFIKDARLYVELAQRHSGSISRPVEFSYIWGDAIQSFCNLSPDARIINLETSITTCDRYWAGKEIHYRMSPGNIRAILSAGIDCCTLANNHVMDWGYEGLAETLNTLHGAGIRTSGAGRCQAEAEQPAVLDLPGKGRVLVFAWGSDTSGIPHGWAAGPERAGVNLLEDMSPSSVEQIAQQVAKHKRTGDVVVWSVHWGGNWGYEIPRRQRQFAHALIERAGVDIIHGHSSHHVKAIEVYQQRLILYGCGDLLTDYEGIRGHEAYRNDLGLMYFADVAAGGELRHLRLIPLETRRMRLCRADPTDAAWLAALLARQCQPYGTRAEMNDDGSLALQW